MIKKLKYINIKGFIIMKEEKKKKNKNKKKDK
jgi:hypothetical protein